METLPWVGLARPAIARSRVVFPAPLSPRMTWSDAAENSAVTPRSAANGPNCFTKPVMTMVGRAIALLSFSVADNGIYEKRVQQIQFTEAQHHAALASATGDMPLDQTWNPQRYAEHAHFVPALGQPLLELLRLQAGERILDLACGDGVLSKKMADQGGVVVGVDSSL